MKVSAWIPKEIAKKWNLSNNKGKDEGKRRISESLQILAVNPYRVVSVYERENRAKMMFDLTEDDTLWMNAVKKRTHTDDDDILATALEQLVEMV